MNNSVPLSTKSRQSHPSLRPQENRLARDDSFYCSAFVRHLFSHVGLELTPGVAIKNTTPEDIAQTALARTKWVASRPENAVRVGRLGRRVPAGAKH